MRKLLLFCTAILMAGTAVAAEKLRLPGIAKQPVTANESLPGGDIEAIAFIVLMEAAKSAQDDVRAIMAQVKAINATKAKLREQLQAEQKLGAKLPVRDPCDGKSVVQLRDCLKRLKAHAVKMELAALDLSKAAVMDAQALSERMLRSMQQAKEQPKQRGAAAFGRIARPCVTPAVAAWKSCLGLIERHLADSAPDAMSQEDLDALIDAAKQELDSMSEMGEMESLRLQMAMDRMSKMMSTLSNLLKKISDTASQITQNLK